jgi:hypothetical protein
VVGPIVTLTFIIPAVTVVVAAGIVVLMLPAMITVVVVIIIVAIVSTIMAVREGGITGVVAIACQCKIR